MQPLQMNEQEKNEIIGRFPSSLHKYLQTVFNPLDETEVLLSIFKDHNVRIVILNITDEYGIPDKEIYFHLSDVGTCIQYNRIRLIVERNKQNKYKYVTYEQLILSHFGLIPSNTTTNITHITQPAKNAIFVDHDNLKNILLATKVDNILVNTFRDWLLSSSNILKVVSRRIILIRQELDKEQKNKKVQSLIKQYDDKLQEQQYQNDLCNKELYEQLKAKEFEIKQLQDKIKILYRPKQESLMGEFIYVFGVEDDTKYKVGGTSNLCERIKALQQGNPSATFLFTKQCKKWHITEKLLHDILKDKRIPNTEWFQINFNDVKQTINNIVDSIDQARSNVSVQVNQDVQETAQATAQETAQASVLATAQASVQASVSLYTFPSTDNEYEELVKSPIYYIKPRTNYNNIENFDNFIKERCIIDANAYVEKQVIYRAYMCWCVQSINRTIEIKFNDYMNTNYELTKRYNQTEQSNMAVYIGIKLKEVEYVFTDNPLDKFIRDTHLGIGPNYYIDSKTLTQLYKEWLENENSKSSTKIRFEPRLHIKLINFFKQRFFKTQVGLKKGYRGIGFNNRINTVGTTKRKVVMHNVINNEIIKTYDSITVAALENNLSISTVHHNVKHNVEHTDKKYIDDKYFVYLE
jgi:hypothetical protein